jgi:hypothetical protein
MKSNPQAYNDSAKILFDSLETMISEDGVLTIPEGVIAIPNKFFENDDRIKKLICPSTLKEFEYNVFSGCKNLQEIVFNEGLKCIGAGTFADCNAITKVNVPSTLTVVEPYNIEFAQIPDSVKKDFYFQVFKNQHPELGDIFINSEGFISRASEPEREIAKYDPDWGEIKGVDGMYGYDTSSAIDLDIFKDKHPELGNIPLTMDGEGFIIRPDDPENPVAQYVPLLGCVGYDGPSGHMNDVEYAEYENEFENC